MAELLAVLSAGRQALVLQRARPPARSESRERLLGGLACTLDEQVAASPAGALLRVRRIADRAGWLVWAPNDPGAPQAELVMRYFERLRAADVPPAMWPVRLIVDEPAAGAVGDAGGAALLFDDLACVSLGGLIRQTAGRDPVLALRIAGSLTRAVYALAQVDYALEPASEPMSMDRSTRSAWNARTRSASVPLRQSPASARA